MTADPLSKNKRGARPTIFKNEAPAWVRRPGFTQTEEVFQGEKKNRGPRFRGPPHKEVSRQRTGAPPWLQVVEEDDAGITPSRLPGLLVLPAASSGRVLPKMMPIAHAVAANRHNNGQFQSFIM